MTIKKLNINPQIQPDQQNNRQYNQPQNYNIKIPIVYKLLITICFIISYTIYRIFYVKFDNSKCLVDTYFQATFEANRWLRYSGGNAIIGIGQVMMDAWILFLGIVWLILVKNMRFPISAGIIFLFRTFFLVKIMFIQQIKQSIQKLPFDDYIVWHSPGFLALTVPYDRTRDFFFSGHTSTLTIIIIQFFILKFPKIGIFAFLNLIFMVNMLIITRIHYTIDIIGAIIFAPTVYRLTYLIIKYIDYVFSIPFYILRQIYKKLIKNNKDQQYKQIQLTNRNNNNNIPYTEQEILRN